MQAIYFPSRLIEFKKDEKFFIECLHDEYSLKFDVFSYDEKKAIFNSNASIGDISLGMTLISRNRLAQLNDKNRNDMFMRLLKKVLTKYHLKSILKNIFHSTNANIAIY